MANFPALKTGAVAQYPSDRTRRYSTQVLRFLDGSEQRFAGFGAPLKRWLIRLELLDDTELAGFGVGDRHGVEPEHVGGLAVFVGPPRPHRAIVVWHVLTCSRDLLRLRSVSNSRSLVRPASLADVERCA